MEEEEDLEDFSYSPMKIGFVMKPEYYTHRGEGDLRDEHYPDAGDSKLYYKSGETSR